MPAGDSLYSTTAMTRHLIDALDVLHLDRVGVIGHSMGGALALHLALEQPRRVSSLVLISAVGLGIALPAYVGRLLSPRIVIPAARVLLTRSVLAAGLRLTYGSPRHVDARNVDEYWAPSQFPGYVPAMRALLHHFRWTLFTKEELARIDAPVLVIRGGRDRVVHAPRHPMVPPRTHGEIVVADAGHLSHDEAPDRVNAEMVAFLREHATRA
jgi:pimeloyl-ACP methyl ester carboxylesterase